MRYFNSANGYNFKENEYRIIFYTIFSPKCLEFKFNCKCEKFAMLIMMLQIDYIRFSYLCSNVFFLLFMEKITMLGTGAAMVTKCYNTCFTISNSDDDSHFLVDAGGGNGILQQLEKSEIKICQIHNAFISHNHTDHILGMVWIVRYIAQEINKDRYEGCFTIYGHQKSLDALHTMCSLLLQPRQSKLIGERIILFPIEHKKELDIENRHFVFFDIHSKKELQHGFTVVLRNKQKLAFLGDEPYNEANEEIIKGSDIIMEEAYCLYSEREKFNPYPKSHGTVLDSCVNAEKLGAKTTILFHTEGRTPLTERKMRYTAEGKTVYSGRLLVPNDLEVIEL